MQLQNQLKALAEKIGKLKDQIDTEESTKHAFVLPFILWGMILSIQPRWYQSLRQTLDSKKAKK